MHRIKRLFSTNASSKLSLKDKLMALKNEKTTNGVNKNHDKTLNNHRNYAGNKNGNGGGNQFRNSAGNARNYPSSAGSRNYPSSAGSSYPSSGPSSTAKTVSGPSSTAKTVSGNSEPPGSSSKYYNPNHSKYMEKVKSAEFQYKNYRNDMNATSRSQELKRVMGGSPIRKDITIKPKGEDQKANTVSEADEPISIPEIINLEEVDDSYSQNDKRKNPKIMLKKLEREKREKLYLKKDQQKKVRDEKKAQKESSRKEKQKTVQLHDGITVSNLSNLIGVSLPKLLYTIKNAGFDDYTPDYVLNTEIASLIVMEYKMIPIVTKEDKTDLKARPDPEDWSLYPARPPVVTIMGHVDHGKTTLLDSLRKTSVAAGEEGGITQHIGAFSVLLPSKKKITFLDTPGHAAFSSMRHRGALVTDIVVLVVAADDGVMPQTIEAINHSLKANVPIIVAINKCDKPGVNPKKIQQDLLRYNVVVEEMGGDVPCVEISGKTGKGLDTLEETIIALAEVSDYRGDASGPVEGFVVESKLSKQFGNVATMIVKRGTLKPGSVLVAGTSWCRVKRMIDANRVSHSSAGPATPIEVLGWKELPVAGDLVLEADTEMLAKKVTINRKRKQEIDESLKSIDDINEKRAAAKATLEEAKDKAREENQKYKAIHKEEKTFIDPNQLRVIIKADVHGSVEAIEQVIQELPRHEVYCDVISSSVGTVTESDVEYAKATGSTIYSFNNNVHQSIFNVAEELKVNVSAHKVIYTVVDSIKQQLSDLLKPEIVTTVVGEAYIQALFPINVKKKIEMIAGCKIMSGKVTRQGTIRLVRNGETMHEGHIKTFKHHKKDILEANKGLECGINIDGFSDIQVGDLIQEVVKIEKKRQIS